MDELTPEIPVPGEPEQGEPAAEYAWLNPPADPPVEASHAWSAPPADPVEPTWATVEPETAPDPEPARPAWAPAVWVPAAPAAPVNEEPDEALAVEETLPVVPPAAPTEAEDAPAPKTSLLKREISFRRKSKAEQGEQVEKTSILKKEISLARGPRAEQAASLLKKEISFKRKPKAQKAKPAERTSLLKKEFSFKRNPKAEKAVAEPAEKRSLLKKEFSLKRKPKAEKAEPAERKSFLKQDISFGRKKSTGPKAQTAAKPARPRKPARTKHAAAAPKKLVGLKIGASQLAAARVVNNGSPQLAQVARAPLAPGIVVGGELRDPDRLADALKDFFAKNKLPKRGVRLGLASNRIGVRVFELEGIDDPRQLANAIRFRAQEALPIPLDEAVLDYQVLDERVDEDGRTIRRVLLVVAYRELIDRYVAACRKAGIQLVGIDLEAFALQRALSGPEHAHDGAAPAALVAVSIGADRSTFAVSDGRASEFARVLEWGGISLDVALARALDLSPSETEPIKRAVGLEDGETPDGLTDEQAAKAREAIRREVQIFARELVSSLQFYQNQPGSLGIAEIVVTGGTSHLAGLAEQLQKLIGVRVRVGDPLEHVRTAKRLKGAEQIGSLTVAIGLGVESPMRAVNLLPKDTGRGTRKTPKPAALVALAGGAVVLIGGVALNLTASGTLSSRQEELAAKQAELATIPRPTTPRPLPVQPGAELAGERGPRVAAVSAALAERVTWDRLLRRFSLVLPDDVWLQTMALTSPSAADPGADPAAGATGSAAPPQGFTITGRTYSHAGVARLLARLGAVPDLENVQLQTSHRLPNSGQELVEFSIVASVRADGASS
jgi:type IV pilus assembly protein PilM